MSRIVLPDKIKLGEGILPFGVLFHLLFCLSLNGGKMPMNEQIAKDLNLELKVVNEAVADLRRRGILIEDRGDDLIQKKQLLEEKREKYREVISLMQNRFLQEASWRKQQEGIREKQLKSFNEVASVFLSNWENTYLKRKPNNVEMDFFITAGKVRKTFFLAHNQYRLAITAVDKEAAQQANHFCKVLINWLTFCDPKIDLVAEGWGIKDMVTSPKLIYLQLIKK